MTQPYPADVFDAMARAVAAGTPIVLSTAQMRQALAAVGLLRDAKDALARENSRLVWGERAAKGEPFPLPPGEGDGGSGGPTA